MLLAASMATFIVELPLGWKNSESKQIENWDDDRGLDVHEAERSH